MDPRILEQMANEPSENEKQELKLFLYGGDSVSKLGSPDTTAQEMYKKAVSIFLPLSEAIRRGDNKAALEVLGKWPATVVNYPLEAPKGDSKVSWCQKMVNMMKYQEDLTKLLLGYTAGVEISGPDDVPHSVANRAIRDTILRGDIKLAAQILEKFFPWLLHEPRFVSLVPYFLTYQELIELTRQGNLSIALWLANHSLQPITESHPWLKEEADKLFELIHSSMTGDPSKISNKELLDDSQRQKTANSVAGAILVICGRTESTSMIKWLEGLKDQ